MLALIGLAVLLQDEQEMLHAAAMTLEKGSFTVHVVPVADLKDALPQIRAAVAGVTIAGEQLADGTYRVTDGAWELYGRPKAAVVRTRDGWRSAATALADLREEIGATAGENDEKRGNVTAALEQYRRMVALLQLVARSVPPKSLLTRLETDFSRVKKISSDKAGAVYEGPLREAAAQQLLQGPYGEYVRDGTLKITDASGTGRVWVSNDLVVKTELKASGRFVVRTEGTRKTTPVAVCVTTKFLKVGETKRDVPPEVSRGLAELEAAETDQ